jgi:very-short-patch-repair endonuclease
MAHPALKTYLAAAVSGLCCLMPVAAQERGAEWGCMGKKQSKRGEALVAIVNRPADWRIVQDHLWYRVPVATAPRRWPPQWLAFYQTKIFRDEAFAVRYFGRVREIRRVFRPALFPDEEQNEKSGREYFQVFLERLESLPRPIVSYRLRRIVFIPTTYHKLQTAEEINDLFDDSPLEDALWHELKRLRLLAERQYHLKADGKSYFLDFALFCNKGKLNIETDGDRWHADPARIPEDNRRNNALASDGWKVLRFNTHQIREEMADYCVPQIAETVNQLGGLEPHTEAPHTYIKSDEGIAQQMTLFDGNAANTTESEREK